MPVKIDDGSAFVLLQPVVDVGVMPESNGLIVSAPLRAISTAWAAVGVPLKLIVIVSAVVIVELATPYHSVSVVSSVVAVQEVKLSLGDDCQVILEAVSETDDIVIVDEDL